MSPPVPGQHSGLGREYRRLGCSTLAALDLHNGHVTARVERRHLSRKFVALGVVYAVVASAAARLSLSLNSHGWESNRLLSIGIGGVGWLMLLNV